MKNPYPSYKQSGIGWLGEFPSSWSVVKLKHYGDISFSSVDRHQYDEERKVSICHYPDAYKNDFISSRTKISSGTCTESEFERFQLIEDLVVLTKDSESADDIGVPAYISETLQDGVVGYHLALVNTNKEHLFGKYLFRYLQTDLASSVFETSANGVTRFGLGKPAIENSFIPLPSLPEQKQIARFLDHQTGIIDALIDKKEALIEKLKEQRQAIINEAVTKGLNPNAPLIDSGIPWLGEIPEHWEVVKFKRLGRIKNGKDQKEVLIDEGGYPILGTGGEFGRASDFLYDKPSVLLGRKGTIDKPQFIEEPFWTVDTLFYTEIFENTEPKFLYYLSTQIPFNALQESSAVPSMTQEKLHNVYLCRPPKSEQKEIVLKLKESLSLLNETNLKIETQIQKLREYRQSLISEAVTGKIDVREWQPKN